MVVVNITDINDHVPEFSQDLYIVDIREDVAIGEMILMVRRTCNSITVYQDKATILSLPL